MLRSQYHLLLEIRSGDEKIADVPVSAVDWTPAAESARFAAVCEKGWPPELAYAADEIFAPRTHPKLGRPYLDGFEVQLRVAGREAFHFPVPSTYFRSYFIAASATLTESGKLQLGGRLGFLIAGYERESGFATAQPRTGSSITLSRTSSVALVEKFMPFGVVPEAAATPVLLRARVVDEIKSLSADATNREVESGGILIGNVCRDPASRAVFVEVTAQVPARRAKATLTSLSFTPECWADLQRALALRKQPGECAVGWWHSHCVRAWQCKNCPAERQRKCPLARMFSADDEHVHRQFSKGFQVAAVVSDVPFQKDSILDIYGWSRGLITRREFVIVSAEGAVYQPYYVQQKEETGEACQQETSKVS